MSRVRWVPLRDPPILSRRLFRDGGCIKKASAVWLRRMVEVALSSEEEMSLLFRRSHHAPRRCLLLMILLVAAEAQVNFVAVGNSRAVPVGSAQNTIAWSTDGIAWNGLGNIIFNTAATQDGGGRGVAYSPPLARWVATGESDTYTISYSNDGLAWFGVPNSLTDIFTTKGFVMQWGQGKFVAGGWGVNTLAYSLDGIFWTGLGNSTITLYVQGLAFSATQNLWVAVGEPATQGAGQNVIATSADGISVRVTMGCLFVLNFSHSGLVKEETIF
jgi:hypothetical protein